MKYITEHDIRNICNKGKTNKYFLKLNESLTPSAKEYINDKKILIIKEEDNDVFSNGEEILNISTGKRYEKNKNIYRERNINRLKLLEAIFLEKISEIMEWDYSLAERLIVNYKNLILIRENFEKEIENKEKSSFIKEKKEFKKKESKDDEKIDESNLSISLEILELRDSRKILKLNYLVNALNEVNGYFEDKEELNKIKIEIKKIMSDILGGK